MKQKIVIKLQMDCEKCRNKALKTAAEVQGVTSVSLEGDDKNKVSVTGDNVNTICLANQLKKKFKNVTILSVEEVKKKTEEEKKKEEKKKMMEACKAVLSCIKCHSMSCSGKCNSCTKCSSPKCDGMLCVTICFKCEYPKSCCECKPCCSNYKICDGGCKTKKPPSTSCSNCDHKNCDGGCKSKKPPSPCFQQCPPWCTCYNCCARYQYQPCYNPYPPNCTIGYESNSDSCSIM